MAALSDRQKDELHKAILDYLHASSLPRSFDALKAESLQTDFQPDPKAKWAGLLEKKWTSVIRLQKKIMDLETRNAQLLEELSFAKTQPAAARSSTDWLPRLPPKHSLTGHRSPITKVAFHPVFSLVASASEDASIKLWDWETGEFERTLKGHTKAVQDCDFDSKGNLLVSCSSDLTLKLWDATQDYKTTKTFHDHDHSISSVRFLPGDDKFASASRDKTIKIWDTIRGFCIKTISGHSEWVRSISPSPDGAWLISASNDQTARMWDVNSGESKLELRGHEHVVEVAVFAPPNSYAAIREMAGITTTVKDLKSAPAFVVTGSRDKTIRIWDTVGGQCVKTLNGHDNWIRSLVFHPSGKYLLSASDDRTIRVWDLTSGRCTKTIEAHSHFVTCMAWARKTVSGPTTNGATSVPEERAINVLATGSVDLTLKIWTP